MAVGRALPERRFGPMATVPAAERDVAATAAKRPKTPLTPRVFGIRDNCGYPE